MSQGQHGRLCQALELTNGQRWAGSRKTINYNSDPVAVAVISLYDPPRTRESESGAVMLIMDSNRSVDADCQENPENTETEHPVSWIREDGMFTINGIIHT